MVESATALNVIARNTVQHQIPSSSANDHQHLIVPDGLNSGQLHHRKLSRTNSGHRQIQRTIEKEELSRRPSYKRIFDELRTAGEGGGGGGIEAAGLLGTKGFRITCKMSELG